MNLPAKRTSKAKRVRDQKTERAVARLRKQPLFSALPTHLVRGYAELSILSAQVKAKLTELGLVNAEGVWSPGIDQFRRLKDSEARYLSLMLEFTSKEAGSRGGGDSGALERAKVVHAERQRQSD